FVLAVTFAVSVAFVAVFGFGVSSELYQSATRNFPPVDQAFTQKSFQSSYIYDRKGRLLYEIFDPNGGRRKIVHLNEIPQSVIDATLGTEDPNFYSNPGVDPFSIMRASVQDVLGTSGMSGAST